MRDLWAVFGRICLDVDFHHQVFSRADNNAAFEQLGDLETFLRITNNLCLGRWEIMEINRCVTENFGGPTRMPVAAAEEDPEVIPVRFQLSAAGPLPFPGNQSFCTAVGLTAVDMRFRAMVLTMATGGAAPSDLVAELSRSTEIHPILPLTAGEAAALLAVIRTKEPQIAAFQQAKWIVPDKIACTVGYSPDPDAPYLHASQAGAIAYLITNPDKFQELRDQRVVLGTLAQSNVFSQLHEVFLQQ
jgi:hypothetical protein